MQEIPLGRQTSYASAYNPQLLFPIARAQNRQDWADDFQLFGEDIWRAYEVSYLHQDGRPDVAVAHITFPADSPFLIESKSFKLYLNSLNQHPFASLEALQRCLEKDLSQASGAQVQVRLWPPYTKLPEEMSFCLTLPGESLDEQRASHWDYVYSPEHLQNSRLTEGQKDLHIVHTHLLKSNCLITSQPDWGSAVIAYRGEKIDPTKLLAYVVSFREHNGFHEHCVETMVHDLAALSWIEAVWVQAWYTRRGGLDITPMRSSVQEKAPFHIKGRCFRQ